MMILALILLKERGGERAERAVVSPSFLIHLRSNLVLIKLMFGY